MFLKLTIYFKYYLYLFISKITHRNTQNKVDKWKIYKELINEHLDKNKVVVDFVLSGGVGDYLIELNYIKYFQEKFKNEVLIRLIGNSRLIKIGNNDLSNSIDKIYNLKVVSINKLTKFGHIVLMFHSRFLKIVTDRNIKELSPAFQDYLNKHIDFYKQNKKLFRYSPAYDGLSNDFALICNKTRINQTDILNYFNITEDYILNFFISDKYLSKFNIVPNEYITLNNSIDSSFDISTATKIMPDTKFIELIESIVSLKLPYKIVILGNKKIEITNNTILNLTGNTSFVEFLSVLHFSRLHIGPEGGMVHIRKAFKSGKSVVYFGSTDPKFYGYSSNVNIENKHECYGYCEWLRDDWVNFCTKANCSGYCQKILKLDISLITHKINEVLTGQQQFL